ncbi:MAG: sigma-54 dependent transcriptional regulator [Acidobacteriota bacterium]|nr:sigma-54 dependent transcriptional regulator [Acidobacteriota bacterium]
MSTVLWLASNPQVDVVQAFERVTQLRVMVADGLNTNWNRIEERFRAVLIELPAAASVIGAALAQAHRTSVPLPVVIYDKDSVLDESLVRPPAMFQHLTGVQSAETLGAVVRDSPRAGTRREAWVNLLIGDSQPMRDLHALIRLIGPRQATALITGETGTGKEMVARAIHMASRRAEAEMVAVNCAAIPENLVEAELFGHAKGAFTGATNPRAGHFEQAHGGTIFLDEIGELPLEAQSKLLRVLQERRIQKIGSSESIPIDTRVIAASNVDLHAAAERKTFREDLLYRLNVVPVQVAPLRERISDIPLLVDHFIDKVCAREGIEPKVLSSSALDRLTSYHWPGNVRQLEHAIEMAVTLAGNRSRLYLGDFSLPSPRTVRAPEPDIRVPAAGVNFEEVTARVEKLLLEEALRACGGNKAKAANILGMKRTTLLYKTKALEAVAS